MKNTWLILVFFLVACKGGDDQLQKVSEKNGGDSVVSDTISYPERKLSGKTEELELEYILWGCACANWVTPADRKQYEDSGLAPHCIFIEPETAALEVPEDFDFYKQHIRIRGQFYLQPGYPKGTIQSEEPLAMARVFRYSQLKVVAAGQ